MSSYLLLSRDLPNPKAGTSKAPPSQTVVSTSGSQSFVLAVPAQPNKIYALLDPQTEQPVAGQKIIRKGKNLAIEVNGTPVVNILNFFDSEAPRPGDAPLPQPPISASVTTAARQYLFPTGLADCPLSAIDAAATLMGDASGLLWSPGNAGLLCVNPVAFGLTPLAALAPAVPGFGWGTLAAGAAGVAGVAAIAGGGGKTPSDASPTSDTRAPTVSVVSKSTSTVVTKDPITFTVTFDEPVVGTVGTGNFSASNGNITSVTSVPGTNQYTVVVTPNNAVARGQVSLSLKGAGLKDSAGNPVKDADLSQTFPDKASQVIDTKAPTVTSVTDTTSVEVTNSPITFTVTFDEDVVGTVNTSSFSATNGTVNTITKVDGANAYTVVVTPNPGVASGNVALSLVGTGLQDAAGNAVANADLSGKDSQAIDTLAPTVTLTAVGDTNDNPDGGFNQGFTVTAVASVTVKVNGAAITLLDFFTKTTPGGLDTYTAKANKFTGTEAITVDASLSDAAGNTGNATQLDLGKVDTTAPLVVLTAVGDTNDNPDGVYNQGFTVTTGASVTVKVNGAAVKLLDYFDLVAGANGNPDTYTAKANQFTGTEAITVDASLSDAAGNTGNATQLDLGKVDTTAPTVTLTAVGDTNDNPDGGFNQGFTVTEGASVTVTVDGTAVTLLDFFTKTTAGGLDTYTAKADKFTGTEVITVDASLSDAAGNTGNATQLDLGKVDTTAPTVTLTAVGDTNDNPDGGFNQGFTVTEGASVTVTVDGTAVTLLDYFDLVAGVNGNPDTYTAKANKFTGTEAITVDASLSDSAGNSGNATQLDLGKVDTTAPTVTLTAVGDTNDNPDGVYNEGFTVTTGATVTVKIGGNPITLLDFFTKTTAGGLDTYTAKANKFTGTEVITVDASLSDAAGNSGNATQLDLGKVDTTAPVVELAAVGDTNDNPDGGFNQGFTVTEGASVTVTVDGTAVTLLDYFDLVAGANGNPDTYTAKANKFTGTEAITVDASLSDAAGNTGNATQLDLGKVDTTAPTVTLAAVGDANDNPDGGFNQGFTVTEGASVTVTVDGTAVTLLDFFTKTTAGGLDTYTAKADKFTGSEAITGDASLSDSAGNTGNATQLDLGKVDTTAPVVELAAVGDANDNPDGVYNEGFTVTAGATVIVTVDGTAVTLLDYFDLVAGANGNPDTYTAKANKFTGTEAITVDASLSDAAGNTGNATQLDLGKVDTTAPVVELATSGDTNGLQFTVTANAVVSLEVNGVVVKVLDYFDLTNANGVDIYTAKAGVFTGSENSIVVNAALSDAAGNEGRSAPLQLAMPKFAIHGESPGDESGWSVSNAGDVNGDGLDDLLIGAVGANTRSGNVYVVFGKSDLKDVQLSDIAQGSGGFVIRGNPNGQWDGDENYNNGRGDELGKSVSAIGDINGDGLADLIVGSPFSDIANTFVNFIDAGSAHVVFGKKDTDAVEISNLGNDGFTLNTPYNYAGGNLLGRSARSAGDVNGDGVADLIVGAEQSVNTNANAYVLFGQTGLKTDVNLLDVQGAQTGFRMFYDDGEFNQAFASAGFSVSSAGDVNGDGLADLLVGATGAGAKAPFVIGAGNAYIVFGKTNASAINLFDLENANNTQGYVIKGEAIYDGLGFSVRSAGDVNGDGLADVIVGTPYNSANAGAAYVVFGKCDGSHIDVSNLPAENGFTFRGLADEYAGYSVSSAGDVNGDGLADLIVGTANGNKSYVIFGKAGITDVQASDLAAGSGGFVIDGLTDPADKSRYAVSAAGDVNGDGFADLIVGGRSIGDFAGKSHVLFGGTRMASTVDFVGDANANNLAGTSDSETFAAGQGNDTLIGGGGADVMMGGAGDDTFVLNFSNLTALQNVHGQGGNDTQLSRVIGGSGLDTLRISALGGDLDLTKVANVGAGGPDGLSRIESIEIIDMASDTGSNRLTIELRDVIDMAGMNLFQVNGQSVAKHQVAVYGGSNDRVDIDLSGWVQSADTVERDGHTLVVYNHASAQAQLLIDQQMVNNGGVI